MAEILALPVKALACFFHPSMKLPKPVAEINFKDPPSPNPPCTVVVVSRDAPSHDDAIEETPFSIAPDATIMELMEKVEVQKPKSFGI